jgi:Raf kinase inhibitor-like YbhB/YbcL family protein
MATGGVSTGGTATGGMATGGAATGGNSSACANGPNNIAPTGGMTLSSPDQAECAHFDVKFTCACGTMNTGIMCSGSVSQNGNNPELIWDNVPAGTKSFAMTFLDTTQLDANSPGMANHWAIWNIPAAARKLPQLSNGMLTGDLMGAKETTKFFEPCPGGTDKYEFALYALSTDTLNVSGTGVMNVRDALKAATPLAIATLHGTTGKGGK